MNRSSVCDKESQTNVRNYSEKLSPGTRHPRAMSRPEEQIVVLVDAAKLLKAERLSSAAGDPQVAFCKPIDPC